MENKLKSNQINHEIINLILLIGVILMKLDQSDGLTKKNCLIGSGANFFFDLTSLRYSLFEY